MSRSCHEHGILYFPSLGTDHSGLYFNCLCISLSLSLPADCKLLRGGVADSLLLSP